MNRHPTTRTIRDWTPDLGDGDQWLAQLEAEGWTPEYGVGTRVTINGKPVVRYALIETASATAGERLAGRAD